jgi:hypothetical protein
VHAISGACGLLWRTHQDQIIVAKASFSFALFKYHY